MVKEARMKCVESMHKEFTFYVEGRKSTSGTIKLLKRKRFARCYQVFLPPPQHQSRNLHNISLPPSSVRVLRNVQGCLIRELKMYILSTGPRVILNSLNQIMGDIYDLILEISS